MILQVQILVNKTTLATRLRGDPFITFAPRGGRGVKEVANFANDKTDRLRETANKGGEGVQNPENSANVINGCPLTVLRF